MYFKTLFAFVDWCTKMQTKMNSKRERVPDWFYVLQEIVDTSKRCDDFVLSDIKRHIPRAQRVLEENKAYKEYKYYRRFP